MYNVVLRVVLAHLGVNDRGILNRGAKIEKVRKKSAKSPEAGEDAPVGNEELAGLDNARHDVLVHDVLHVLVARRLSVTDEAGVEKVSKVLSIQWRRRRTGYHAA
jgi:hypothetical protein